MADGNRFTVEIDGSRVEVPPGTILLDALKEAGADVPALCASELVEPYGACRLCMVEVDDGDGKRLVASCTYPVRGNLKVETSSERVRSRRAGLLEMMYARWPRVRAVVELAEAHGVQRPRVESPRVDCNPHACILCGLCVEVCGRGLGYDAIHFAGGGLERRLRTPDREADPHCTACGVCVDICPTGALKLDDDPNDPQDPGMVRRAGMELNRDIMLRAGRSEDMRRTGTAHLVGRMCEENLLPVMNHRFGSHEEADRLCGDALEGMLEGGAPDSCWSGCTLSCRKRAREFEPATGPYRGEEVTAEGPDYRTVAGAANMGIFEPEFILEYCFYCGTYGIDPASFASSAAFAMECFEKGIIDTSSTEGLKLAFGSSEAALELLHAVAEAKGFGRIAGKGIRFMKYYFEEHFGADPDYLDDIGMECGGLECLPYVTKESPALQAAWGTGSCLSRNDQAWLLLKDAVDGEMPDLEERAEALRWFPLWSAWFGLCGLCSLPWNAVEAVDEARHVDTYCRLFEGVTGRAQTPESLLEMAERVCTFQRVFDLRMGYGTREHDRAPCRSMVPVTEEEYEARRDHYDRRLREEAGIDPGRMSATERISALKEHGEKRYGQLLDAVYRQRGWDDNGVPTESRLGELGMDFPEVLQVLRSRG